MNVFQVLENRENNRLLSRKERIRLTGARMSQESTKSRIRVPTPQIRVARPSVRCSQFGMGLEIDNNDLQKMIENSIDPDLKYLKKHKKFTISPKNKFKRPFDTLMCILPTVSIISSMYFLAFHNPTTLETVFDLLIWALFVLDFFLVFFTEFVDKKRRNVRNLKLIALNYVKGRMVFDFIALVPLRFSGNFKTECFFRLCRLARVSDIYKLVNIYAFSEKVSSALYNEGTMAKKKLVLKIFTIWEIIQQVMRMFFIALILAALWYAFVQYIERKYNEEYNFITYFNLIDNPESEQFIKTWYFVFTTLMTVGYGDFYAVNKYEQIFAIFLLLTGPTWFAFAMGNAIALINDLSDLTGRKHNKTNLEMWMSLVEGLYKEVPYEMKQEIMKHYVHLWKNDRLGSLFNNSQEADFKAFRSSAAIFSALPKTVQEEILEYLFSDVFYNFRVFFKAFDRAKYQICRFLQPRVYIKQSVIIHFSTQIEEILLVESGLIQLSIYKSDIRLDMFKTEEKCILGDYFVINKIPSSVEYRSVNNVKGFSVPVFAFLEIAKLYNLNLKKYNEMINPLYRDLESTISETLRRAPEITKFREDGRLIEKISPSTGDTFELYKNGKIVCFENERREMDLMKVVESMASLLKDCNWRRIQLLKKLKEQIAETMFERMRIV